MNVEVAVLGSPSLIIPMVFVAVNNIERRTAPELWSCVRVEVGVLGSHSLDEGCGLHKVFRVAQQMFSQRCSMRPLLPCCLPEEGAELQNMLWGLWSCWHGQSLFSVCQP